MWGNHVFVVTAINVKQPVPTLNAVGTYLARSLGGPMTGGDISQPVDEHRWVLYDIDFSTGKINWERTVHAAVPLQPVHQKNSYASETPVTDGQRVYVYLGYVGLFAFDMSGKPVVVEADARGQDAHRLGPRLVTRPPRRPHLHRQRQRRAVVCCGVRRAHRQRVVARRARSRRLELVDAIRVAERSPHRDRDDRHEGRALVRSLRETAVAAHRHDVDPRRDADRESWTAVCELRLLSGFEAADLCDQAGRDRRYQPERRRAQQRVHRLVASDPGAGVSVAARAGRSVLHADGSRLRHRRTIRRPARRFTDGSASPSMRERSRRRRGPTTASSSRSARTATPLCCRPDANSRCSAEILSAK